MATILTASAETVIRSFVDAPGKLPESIKQEVIAATDRAARYLAAKQLPDTSWPGLSSAQSDRVALAVRTSPIPEAVSAFAKRVEYTIENPLSMSPGAPPPTNSMAHIESICTRATILAIAAKTNSAWRTLEKLQRCQIKTPPAVKGALTLNIATNTPAAPALHLSASEAIWTLNALLPPPPAENFRFNLTDFKNYIRSTPSDLPEMLLSKLLLNLEIPDNAVGHIKKALLSLPIHRDADITMRELRNNVVLLNSAPQYAPDRMVMKDGSLIDWRQKVAEFLIAKQRIDPSTGYGFWKPLKGESTEPNILLASAMALHILTEL